MPRRAQPSAPSSQPLRADAPSQLALFDVDEAALPAVPTPQPAPTAAPHLQAAPPEPAHHPHRLFQHPHGNRDIVLDQHRVSYALRRARRRTIGFVVGDDGLAVAAPRWVAQAEIDAALQAKSAWILRKLVDQHERLARLDAARIDWRDGAELPYLGEPLIIVLDPRVDGALLNASADALPGVARRTLHVGLPHDAAPAQIRDSVQSWLQRQALGLFKERCALYAERLGVRVRRLALSSAHTRWGSAKADGSIRLHWRLLHFALPTIDYVVAHELAHLREMNHSPAFWDVVRSVMPDYEQARGALRSDVLPVFD
ncbi:MAG: SprT family zinc-dependent metalloprotease [Burkholderiales bacterium]